MKWGVHLANDDETDDLSIAKELGDNFTLLHYQAAKYLPRLQDAKGIVLVRYYDKAVLEKNPIDYAQAVCTEALKWHARHWTFANEVNLPAEGGKYYHDPDYVGNWLIDVATELRRLAPWMVIHMPAFAPVGNWWEYYANVAPWLSVFDFVDAHTYGSIEEMVTDLEAICSQTDKPVFVSEFNGRGSLELLKWAETQDQIAGVAYFITRWHKPDDAWHGNLLGSELEKEWRKARKEMAPTTTIGNLEVYDLRGELPDEPRKMPQVDFTEKDFISIHHTVTPTTTTAKAIYHYHKQQGWGGIGYNFLVYQDGRIEYVGECNTSRAAVGQISQGNRRGVHIAMVIDLTKEEPSEAMLASVKKLIANIQHAYGFFMLVVPHRLFNSSGKWDTSCPVGWRKWWKNILRAVGE